jgi:hypothetical protein
MGHIQLNQFCIRLHLCTDAGERGEQGFHSAEQTIVRFILRRRLPEPFGGIELWRVGWQWMQFQPVPAGVQPTPDLAVFALAEPRSRSGQHKHFDARCRIFLVVDLFCSRLEIFRLGKRNVSKSLRIAIRQREP